KRLPIYLDERRKGRPPGRISGGDVSQARPGGLPTPATIISAKVGHLATVVAAMVRRVATAVAPVGPSGAAVIAARVPEAGVAPGRPERAKAVAADAAPRRDAVVVWQEIVRPVAVPVHGPKRGV